MNIRRAFKGDLAALAAMEAGYPEYPAWGEKGLEAELGKPFSVTLVAEEGGAPAGFVNFWVLRPQIQLNSIVVAGRALRGGVATALIGKLEEYAKKSACREVDLEVNERNAPALALYAKLGFEVVGRRPKFYNNTDAAVLMRKTLPGGER
ncbi:MAG TPA: GNAT family N-acetyltransferase [Elusimicrobiales bacterium]|nr:GNAT family N-acetyltransferase [Elusimicrobiales bacterium]